MATHRFEVRFGFWRPLLALFGTGPGRTRMTVEGDALVVQMGWAFRTSIPLGSIAKVYRDEPKWWLGIGVHGLRGTWQINGALGSMITVEIDPPARARVLSMFGVDLRQLHVSVTEPDEVVATLRALARR